MSLQPHWFCYPFATGNGRLLDDVEETVLDGGDASTGTPGVHLYKVPKDRALYRKQYLVEVFFHNVKRFRAIATRYDKTRVSYLAFVHIACIALWLN